MKTTTLTASVTGEVLVGSISVLLYQNKILLNPKDIKLDKNKTKKFSNLSGDYVLHVIGFRPVKSDGKITFTLDDSQITIDPIFSVSNPKEIKKASGKGYFLINFYFKTKI